MNIKSRDLPYTIPFEHELKQVNKTKRIVLLDCGLFNTDLRSIKESSTCNIFQSNTICKPYQLMMEFVKNPAAGASDRKLDVTDIRLK